MTANIIKNIKSYVPLNNSEEEAFIKVLEFKKIKKKEFLFKEGQKCDKITFIESGSVRLYYNIEGVENTIQFFFDGSWYTDYASFLTNNATLENLQALEESQIVQIKKENVEMLYEKVPVFERIGRIFAENAFLSVMRLNQMKTNEEPEVRYLNLLKSRPELIQKIPQHYIASYLGIKPETLSRIRKRILTSN